LESTSILHIYNIRTSYASTICIILGAMNKKVKYLYRIQTSNLFLQRQELDSNTKPFFPYHVMCEVNFYGRVIYEYGSMNNVSGTRS